MTLLAAAMVAAAAFKRAGVALRGKLVVGALVDEEALTCAQVGRGRQLTAMQTADRRPQTLIFEAELALRVALATQTLQAAQKPFETSLPPLRSVIHWPLVQNRAGSRLVRRGTARSIRAWLPVASNVRAAPSVMASGQV